MIDAANQSNIVLIVGGCLLPDRSASATRCIGVAHLLIKLGYIPIVVGKFPHSNDKAVLNDMFVEGVRCINIEQPKLEEKFPSYVISAEPILSIINAIGVSKIRAIITYNYPPRGGFYITRACRLLGIPVIFDCTEWYGWEGRKIIRNLLRMLGTSVRMRLLTRYAKNVICISTFLKSKMSGCNTIMLPLVVDINSSKWASFIPKIPKVNQVRQFVYSGSPGVGMNKDLLPVVIESLHVLHLKGYNFSFKIAGITKADYLEVLPNHRYVLEDMQHKIVFLGRISHDNALEVIISSDYSVFLRQSNRANNAGFPTKFVESYTLGIPVITNDTSDIHYYLNDGKNGFIAKSIAKDSIIEVLRKAIELDSELVLKMKFCCLSNNPFNISNWEEPMKVFMENLKVSHV